MQNKNIDSGIKSFYYIKKFLLGKKKLENILKELKPVVKFICFRGTFCWDFAY